MDLIKKTDRIYIAGHTGMVGGAIKKELLKKGYSNLLLPQRKDLDLREYNLVKDWFKENNPDIVILAAAKVGGIQANFKFPGDFILENLKIQNNVIENAWRNDVKRLLFLGSSCIYPKFAPQPLRESYLLTGPLEITNESYAIAKIAGIKLCSSLKEQYGFDAISLMPTNLYGPGDNYHEINSHVIPSLIRKFYNAKVNNYSHVSCWGSGSPKRDFLFVDDLAEAALHTLENVSSDNDLLFEEDSKFNGIINIGLGKDISIKELAELISEETNFKGEILWDLTKPDGTPRKLLDISKANKLGWRPKIDIKDGVKLAINSFIKELENQSIRL